MGAGAVAAASRRLRAARAGGATATRRDADGSRAPVPRGPEGEAAEGDGAEGEAAEGDGSQAPARTASREVPDRPKRRAYRLGRGEPAGEGLRRIAIGRLDHALRELDSRHPDADAVHEARKDLKKLRSVLRLLRRRLSDEVYRSESTSARDTGRLLAGPRDAQVRLDTLMALIADGDVAEDRVSGFRTVLDDDLLARTRAHDVGSEPAERIAAARSRASEWEVGRDGWDAVGRGLKRSYRRGRARMADARAAPSVESLHEWRKRVKDLWYHLRILTPAWPRVIEALAEEAHVLSERLGDDHDLAMLAASARRHHDAFEHPGDLDALLEAIERRRAGLQDDAFAIGRRLYAEEPSAFVNRAEVWWDAWRPA
jgi:CHAD domain-containing protein